MTEGDFRKFAKKYNPELNLQFQNQPVFWRCGHPGIRLDINSGEIRGAVSAPDFHASNTVNAYHQ